MQGFKRNFHISKDCHISVIFVDGKLLPANRRSLLPPPLGFVLSNKIGCNV